MTTEPVIQTIQHSRNVNISVFTRDPVLENKSMNKTKYMGSYKGDETILYDAKKAGILHYAFG
jgi:hypothetical protein